VPQGGGARFPLERCSPGTQNAQRCIVGGLVGIGLCGALLFDHHRHWTGGSLSVSVRRRKVSASGTKPQTHGGVLCVQSTCGGPHRRGPLRSFAETPPSPPPPWMGGRRAIGGPASGWRRGGVGAAVGCGEGGREGPVTPTDGIGGKGAAGAGQPGAQSIPHRHQQPHSPTAVSAPRGYLPLDSVCVQPPTPRGATPLGDRGRDYARGKGFPIYGLFGEGGSLASSPRFRDTLRCLALMAKRSSGAVEPGDPVGGGHLLPCAIPPPPPGAQKHSIHLTVR